MQEWLWSWNGLEIAQDSPGGAGKSGRLCLDCCPHILSQMSGRKWMDIKKKDRKGVERDEVKKKGRKLINKKGKMKKGGEDHTISKLKRILLPCCPMSSHKSGIKYWLYSLLYVDTFIHFAICKENTTKNINVWFVLRNNDCFCFLSHFHL